MQESLVVGFVLGLLFYHILVKKLLSRQEKGKLLRIIDVIKEKKKPGDK